MTKTFPPLLQYPFEPFEGILCFVGHSDLPRIDYVAKVVASTGNLETFEKPPLLPNYCVRLRFQSSKYSMYSCG